MKSVGAVRKSTDASKEWRSWRGKVGFSDVCLNRWVLHTAGIGLKTKAKKSYTTMLTEGNTAEHE